MRITALKTSSHPTEPKTHNLGPLAQIIGADREIEAGKRKMAKLTPVESSMIQAVGYDSKTRLLEVVFNNGRTYCYEGVPPKVHKGLMAAESKGRYMLSEIIDMYSCHIVSGRRRR